MEATPLPLFSSSVYPKPKPVLMKKLFALMASAVISAGAFAQLPNGSVAPDFTATDIDGVEALPDPEQEHADDDERDQDRESHADLHDQRHALGAGRGQHQSVFQRHEADDLADGVAPRGQPRGCNLQDVAALFR